MEYRQISSTPKFTAGMYQLERIEKLIDDIVNAYAQSNTIEGYTTFIQALQALKPFISIHLDGKNENEDENLRKRYETEIDNGIKYMERFWSNIQKVGIIGEEFQNYKTVVNELYNMTIFLKQTGGLGIPVKEEMDLKKKIVSGLNIESVDNIVRDLEDEHIEDEND